MGLFDFITDAIGSPSTFIGAAIGLGLAFAFPALLPLTALGILGTGAAVGAAAGALYEFTSNLIPDITSDSPTYNSNQPVYTVEEGTSIAKCYGRCRIAGNIIRSNDPGEETLKVLIGHGRGEIDSLLSWKINNVEWDHLTDVKWWVAGYAGSVHFKNTALGTDSQTVIQVDGADLFALDACAHRGIAHTGFKLTKNDQIAGLSSILVEGKFALCEPIGGGAKVFSRCPAVIMWDFYRDIEGYEIADLDINAFNSLKTLCDFYPTSGDGGPIRPPGPN
ncbi:hypothetical protein KA005_23075, partial [bacterium]|nr:hypothetical protein [bacterium]